MTGRSLSDGLNYLAQMGGELPKDPDERMRYVASQFLHSGISVAASYFLAIFSTGFGTYALRQGASDDGAALLAGSCVAVGLAGDTFARAGLVGIASHIMDSEPTIRPEAQAVISGRRLASAVGVVSAAFWAVTMHGHVTQALAEPPKQAASAPVPAASSVVSRIPGPLYPAPAASRP